MVLLRARGSLTYSPTSGTCSSSSLTSSAIAATSSVGALTGARSGSSLCALASLSSGSSGSSPPSFLVALGFSDGSSWWPSSTLGSSTGHQAGSTLPVSRKGSAQDSVSCVSSLHWVRRACSLLLPRVALGQGWCLLRGHCRDGGLLRVRQLGLPRDHSHRRVQLGLSRRLCLPVVRVEGIPYWSLFSPSLLLAADPE